MRCGYIITMTSVNKKKPGEETSTSLCQTRPAEKVIIVTFWNKYDVLLTECLSCETMISGPYYALIIERLRCAILEKRGGKVVLLLHDNAPIHKCSIVQAAIRSADFVELNHCAYSPNIASSDFYLVSKLKKFLGGKSFSRVDEVIDTVEDYLNRLD